MRLTGASSWRALRSAPSHRNGQTPTRTPARGFTDVRTDTSGVRQLAATGPPGVRIGAKFILQRSGSPRTWPQLTVGGELGPARTVPYTLRWERPDAKPQPNLSALR